MEVEELATGCPGGARGKAGGWAVLALMAVSLIVRVAVWIPAVRADIQPQYDEWSYLKAAVAYDNVLSGYFEGGPAELDLERAYRQGTWPPLHALLIGLGFWVFGRSLAVARLLIVVQSVLATGVVCGLTSRLAGRRAGLFAGGIHAVYPSFVSYSHLLWSETTYILMCLGMLYFAVRVVGEERWGRRIRLAVACGLLLGLAGLTRAAALPLFVVVPLWLVWRSRRGKWRWCSAAVVVATALITISPWEAVLWANEHRVVTLSTSGGYNLYLGNNPQTEEDRSLARVRVTLNDYAARHGVSGDVAGRTLAFDYIRANPGVFIARCWGRARALCVMDWYTARQMLYAVYPPLPPLLATAVLLVLWISFTAFVSLVVYGLSRRELACRGLLVGCAGFAVLPSMACLANSRMALPSLAMLLPAAGVGLSSLVGQRRWIRGVALLCVTGAALWLLNPALPRRALGVRDQVSAYYGDVVRRLERVFGQERVAAGDHVYMRYRGGGPIGRLRLRVGEGGYVFEKTGSATVTWRPPPTGKLESFRIRSERIADTPPAVEIVQMRGRRRVMIRPVKGEDWRRWRPTGIAGVDYYWAGSAGQLDLKTKWLFESGVEDEIGRGRPSPRYGRRAGD